MLMHVYSSGFAQTPYTQINCRRFLSNKVNEKMRMTPCRTIKFAEETRNTTEKEEDISPTNGWSGDFLRIITLWTDSRFFLAVFGITLTSGQAAFQLLRHALIAVLAHWF